MECILLLYKMNAQKYKTIICFILSGHIVKYAANIVIMIWTYKEGRMARKVQGMDCNKEKEKNWNTARKTG